MDEHLKRRLAVTAASALTIALAGCSVQSEERISADQARDALHSLISDTAEQLGDGTWNEVVGPPYSSKCGSADAVKFAYSVSTERGMDPRADAEEVAEYWLRLGMSVKISDGPVLAVFGSGGPVSAVSFGTGPAVYSISGTSRCSTGE
ncbi:hypothetical protein [Microbacterium sp. HMWF026]|uniref:hypothetical protein n=1 Tax=Microbacterium sp. HMWF026 TaxID=2056861 RepID=UPI0011B29FE9|nr:hypothetical protein [Microbacterium sp. HMWF026]